MIKLVLCAAFLAAAASAIDNTVFRNCSQIEFCSKYRNYQLSNAEKFKANFTNVKVAATKVSIELFNKKNETLTLTVSWSGDIARLIVEQPGNKRFIIPGGFSLRHEPQKLRINVTVSEDKVTIKREGELNRIEIVNNPHLELKAHNIHDKIIATLSANRLLMENTNTSQVFTFSVKFHAPKIYGLFDHAWKLSLGTTVNTTIDPFRMRNSDSWGHEANSPMALYGAIPAIYGHTAHQTSGIFLHNAAEQWIDTDEDKSKNSTSAYFMVEGAAFDLFLLFGPTPKDVVKQMTKLTGTAQVPQLWTLGYHQCRFSYKSQEDVKTVTARMVESDFPMDAIWVDGDHTDDYRWFKWNHTTYPDPVEMQANISSYHKVCVTISDPHIKAENNYSVYAGAKGKYFVQWSNGSDYIADCWPGASSWIDYFLPEAADYYSTWFAYNKFNGSTTTLAGIWNDMNEPAVFDETIEKTFPFRLIHRLDDKGKTVTHGDVHNLYGLMHTRSTYKGLIARDQGLKRPFILTRSTFAGSQRYAAMWTGDNSATWEHFANSLAQCMTGNILGQVFCGADIGGFIGDPSEELLQRWYQGAVWTPFFRGHSSREAQRREPFLFSTPVRKVIRNAIKLRYKHIPYLYTLFYEHNSTGEPIISPLFYRYPGIQERDTQMLVGEDIMAVAVVNASVHSVEVLFPGNKTEIWYQVNNGTWKPYKGGDVEHIPVDIETSPLFYRGGSVIFRNNDVKGSTFLMDWNELDFYINCNEKGHAKGTLFRDDHTSFDYITKKKFVYWEISYDHSKKKITFKVAKGTKNSFQRPKPRSLTVHSVKKTEDGYSVIRETFTTTRTGIPLQSVDIADEMTIFL